MNTPELRKSLKAKRLALPRKEQQACADAIAHTLINHPIFKQSQHVAIYLPMGGEVDMQGIIQALREAGKQCYLPVLAADEQKHLCFMPYNQDTALIKNKFGILEPIFDAELEMPAASLDLVLTPLVAFDKQCHRIGMGAGFYDRTFAFLNTTPRSATPILCGLAYGFQQVDNTQPQSWDVPLNMVITEGGVTG